MGRTKGSTNKKRSGPKTPASKSSNGTKSRVIKKTVEKDIKIQTVVRKPKVVFNEPTKLENGRIRFETPTCYICLKEIKEWWNEASVDKPNNVFRHHRCSWELLRRWYQSMGMVYEPKVPEKKERDLIIED